MASPDALVQGWFRRLPAAVKRELAQTIKEEAEQLAAKIKAAAPVDTGALRDSVKVRRRRRSLEFAVVAGGDDTTREIRSGSGEPFDYSEAIEFGTQRQPAQPFFYSTFNAEQEAIRERIEEAVQAAIENA